MWGHNWGWNQSLSLNLAYGKAVSDWRQPFQTSSGRHHQTKPRWHLNCEPFSSKACITSRKIKPAKKVQTCILGTQCWQKFGPSKRAWLPAFGLCWAPWTSSSAPTDSWARGGFDTSIRPSLYRYSFWFLTVHKNKSVIMNKKIQSQNVKKMFVYLFID